MLELNLNTVTGEWFDRDLNPFRSNNPKMAFQSRDRVDVYIYTETTGAGEEGATKANWVADTSFVGISGLSGKLTIDNDRIHKIKGKTTTDIAAGSVSSVAVSLSGSTLSKIPESGSLRLFDAQGNTESLAYTSRSLSANVIMFTTSGSVTESYATGATVDFNQSPYCEASLNVANSDIANGKFSFDLVIDSNRLREEMLYSDIANLSIAGMEFLVYKTTNGDSEPLSAWLLDTFAITGLMGNVDYTAYPPDSLKNEINSYIDTAVQDKTPVIGNNGNWFIDSVDTQKPSRGDQGLPGYSTKIRFSQNGTEWHNAFQNGDKYISFSSDNGVTWSASAKFVGDNAPVVSMQFSVSGGANTWHDSLQSGDYFIRFSADNGVTYTGAMQIVAYAVKYQYGSTATDTFHADFIEGTDKFIKISSDNGVTWTNAIRFVGLDGQSFTPDATGTEMEKSAYDGESKGFSFLVTSGTNAGKIYFKKSSTSADWSDALLFTPPGLTIQYSADGTSWHVGQANTDFYIRFSTDNGTTWSTGGQYQGKSSYAYTGYASDASGNDFSLTPSGSLDYWNWIHTYTPIGNNDLTLAKFTSDGDGWRKYQGNDGITYDWLSGTTAPSANSGKNGDWYLNTSAGDLYLKSSGEWVLKMNIVGATGAGITLRGEWNITTSYQIAAGVTHNGNFYISNRANTGVEPGTSADDWTLYVAKGDKGEPGDPLEANFVSVSTLTSGKLAVEDSTIPVMVETNSGAIYPIEKNTMTHSGASYLIDPAAYLAYDNAASFSGTWKVWRAGGKKGTDGNDSAIEQITIGVNGNWFIAGTDTGVSAKSNVPGPAGTLTVIVSATQPSSAVDGTIWIQE